MAASRFTTSVLVCVLCVTFVHLTNAFLVSSSNSVANFTKVDLSKNLAAYIKHEEIRLGVIKGMFKYEDEVPLVQERIAEFRKIEESLAENIQKKI